MLYILDYNIMEIPEIPEGTKVSSVAQLTNEIAITITLNSKWLTLHNRLIDPEEQFTSTVPYLQKFFVDNNDVQFDGLMITELTKNYDIHYHGLFKWADKSNCVRDQFNNDIIYYIKYVLKHKPYYNVLGFNVIKPCTDPEKWYLYITKDIERSEKILNRSPIAIDTRNLKRHFPLPFTKTYYDFKKAIVDTPHLM